MLKTVEDRYYELMEEKDRAVDAYWEAKNSFSSPYIIELREERMSNAINDFQSYCAYILEELITENADVLKRLKNI
jgi:hypothetical protein